MQHTGAVGVVTRVFRSLGAEKKLSRGGLHILIIAWAADFIDMRDWSWWPGRVLLGETHTYSLTHSHSGTLRILVRHLQRLIS